MALEEVSCGICSKPFSLSTSRICRRTSTQETSSWPYSWDWYNTWSRAAVHAPPLRPAGLGSWNWEFILDTSADVWASCEPEIMRTLAGMALRAFVANFSRFLDEGCFFGAERVPFFWEFDLVLELFFDFWDFLDCCFFGPGRVSSCGFKISATSSAFEDCLGLDLLRLRSLGLELLERPSVERLSLGASLGLDLLLERLLLGDSLGRDLLRLLRSVWLDSRVREDLSVFLEALVSVTDFLLPTDRPSPPLLSRLLRSLPLLLLCRLGLGGGGGGLLRCLLLDGFFDGRFSSTMIFWQFYLA
mmetsp:Transcript_5161/g.11182  ORF Transcript_5161/g.11182 Transcript_5161/m.11182 type:complete len:302 (+) Transcript_5161:950-1855(+)